MTFRYIRYLIQQYCGKQFSYLSIRNNVYINNSFRTYKKNRLRMLRLLDCDFLMNILGAVRSFNPSEVEAIRRYVQEQLRRQTNPRADDLTSEYEATILNNPNHARYTNAGFNLPKQFGPPYWWIPKPTQSDARFNPPHQQAARIQGQPTVLPPGV